MTEPRLSPGSQAPDPDVLAGCCGTGQDAQLSRPAASAAAHVLKAVADPARLQILAIIRSSPGSEACACDLTSPVGLSQPTVSHHLKVLTDAGILNRDQRGTWAWFSIDESRLREIRQLLADFAPPRAR